MKTSLRAVFFNAQGKTSGIAGLAENYPGVEFVAAGSIDALAATIEDAAILVVNNRSYDADVARVVRERGTRLRWIQFTTAGIDQAIEHGLPPGVPVCTASGVKARTVAEHGMALMLASFRRLRDIETARGRREWARQKLDGAIRTLEGATLVIVGLGAIGREVARKAKGFDMKVVAISRAASSDPAIDEIVPREGLHDTLPQADVVLLSLPLTSETYHLIGRNELSLMKSTAFLINIARGGLVDEEALVDALQRSAISGAAIDVAETEPLPADSPLWTLENVLISPHVSGSGSDGHERFKEIFSTNLARLVNGEPLLKQVDWESAPASSGG